MTYLIILLSSVFKIKRFMGLAMVQLIYSSQISLNFTTTTSTAIIKIIDSKIAANWIELPEISKHLQGLIKFTLFKSPL